MVTSDAIAAMKMMASDPKKRAVLAKDATCIGGLVIVLSNADSTIVQESLKTLLLLCECAEARKTLANHVGIVDQLEHLLTGQNISPTVENLASSLYTKLSESTHEPLKDCGNISGRKSTLGSRNTSLQGQPKAKSIVLQIRGLHDKGDRDFCARLLLKVKGVISITFDLNKKRCILRTKPDVKAETLVNSIARSMTMSAVQVIRNENGDESFVAFTTSGPQPTPAPSMDKENEALPEYLSDDSDTSIIDDKALKRPTEEDKKKSAGWFSVAANFLTNSFYW